MAIKAVNDSIDPNDTSLSLAVYCAIRLLGLLSDHPSPSTHQTAIAVKKAKQSL